MRHDEAAGSLPHWWLPVLRKAAGISDFTPHSLQRYVPHLQQLSGYLNDVEERRSAAGSYMRDRRLREAYLLYYVTCNFLKLLWPLGELWPDGPPQNPESESPFRVLDIGCGPGTGIAALHAWHDQCSGSRPISVKGIDSVSANAVLYREIGVMLRAESGHQIDCDAEVGDARHLEGESGSYDLVMGMNVLNEIPEPSQIRFLQRCAELLDSTGTLLLIEPALRTTSRGLLRLRDQAVKEGWNVRVPCFRQGECPALISEKDWCHHDVPWDRPDFIAWIGEEIGNIKKSLKFSCMVLSRNADIGKQPEDSMLRVVSELFVEKGRSWCFCCGGQGRRAYQRNHRDDSDLNTVFGELKRYDAIMIEGEEEREHDVRISANATVQRREQPSNKQSG